MPVSIPISYNDIFQGDLPDERELLEQIPKWIYEFLGPSLISVSDPNNHFDDFGILSKYFSNENKELKFSILSHLNSEDRPRSLVNSISSYEIMEHYYSLNLPSSSSLSNADLEYLFWKAYLIINQKNNEKSNQSVNAFKHLPNALNIQLITTINVHDITNYNQYHVITAQLIKVVLLFQFLESDKKFEPYLEKFLELKHCTTWQEYLKKACAFILPYVGEFDKTFHDINVPDDEHFDESCQFLDTFSISPNSYKEIPDFVGLRSHVLNKIEDGKYRISSVLFLIESLYKSLRFYLTLKIHKSLTKNKRISMYSIISGEFSENIVMYSVLEKVLNSDYLIVKGEEFKNYGHSSGEPDFFAMDKNSVLLFESKDVILKGEVKQSLDHELIIQELKDKFYKIDSASGGIPQIAENVFRVLDGTYDNVMDGMKAKGKAIYPILVIHDRQFDTPGINNLLINWFKKELREVNDGQNISKVQNLTIINNDTLLALQTAFEDSKYSFARLIQLYHKQLGRKKKKRGVDFDYIAKNYVSFSLFLENEIGHLEGVKTPELIKDFYSTVF